MWPLCRLLFKHVDRSILPAYDRFPYILWHLMAVINAQLGRRQVFSITTRIINLKWTTSTVPFQMWQNIFADYDGLISYPTHTKELEDKGCAL